MIEIDGSFGEGGGQILRSALALSIVTGRPFRIAHIRAQRPRPGLRRQHLTAVHAATQISRATVRGANLGSAALEFVPRAAVGGDYAYDIGTAGSTTLVLQTILLPLGTARGSSRIVLQGGTHNPFAPPFDFLERAYLPLLERMGPRVEATLHRAGFHPAGGGRLTVGVTPAASLDGFELLERGELVRRSARAVVSKLPRHIAEREAGVIARGLDWDLAETEIVELHDPAGPGNVVTIELQFEHVTEVFTGFGQVGRPAEAVATFALRQCRRYLEGSAAVGAYLTDQLLLPLALAGGGAFRSTGLSRHAETHVELIRRFLDVPIALRPHAHGEVTVVIG